MRFYRLVMEVSKYSNQRHREALLEQLEPYEADNAKLMFKMMLDPGFVFGAKKLPERKRVGYTVVGPEDPIEFESDIYNELLPLRGLPMTKAQAHELADRCTDEAWAVINWILAGKCPAQIGTALVNKVWPGTCADNLYMGGVPCTKKALDKLDWQAGVLSEVKENGMAFMAHVDGDDIRIMTRNNLDLTYFYPHVRGAMEQVRTRLDRLLKSTEGIPRFDVYNRPFTMHFEAFMLDEYKTRYNVAMNNTHIMYPYKAGKRVWLDPQTEQTVYIPPEISLVFLDFYYEGIELNVAQRHSLIKDCELASLTQYLDSFVYAYVFPVTGVIHHDKATALQWGADLIRMGGEGAMHKQAGKTFSNGKPSWVVKQKNEFDMDLCVVGVQDHSTKKGWIGALICEPACGSVTVTVGGLPESLMKNFRGILGKVVQVRAEAIIADKLGRPSLKHPRFITIRDDKYRTDTWHQVELQFEASLQSLAY